MALNVKIQSSRPYLRPPSSPGNGDSTWARCEGGSCDFHLVRTGERRRIDRFKFNLKLVDGNLNLEGNQ